MHVGRGGLVLRDPMVMRLRSALFFYGGPYRIQKVYVDFFWDPGRVKTSVVRCLPTEIKS